METNAPTLEKVVRRVQAFVVSQPRQKRAICRQAGLAPNTLARVEAPDWTPSFETLRRLEALIPADFLAEPRGSAVLPERHPSTP